MNEDLRALRYSRRLSFVPRWVVATNIRQQSVAEHSYHVACLSNWLMMRHERADDPYFRDLVLVNALTHDALEAIEGDSPSPSKDGTRPKASSLTDVQIVVKVADKLEAAIFCHEEMEMGNKTMAPVYKDVIERGKPYWELFPWAASGAKPDFASLASRLCDVLSPQFHPVIYK